jgi:phage protein D
MVDKKPAEIVNLKKARKDRARAGARAGADANRARHGQSKSEKALAQARKDKAARDLDAHKRDETD